MFSFFRKNKKVAERVVEFSANFDSEDVRPFLERISKHVESGFDFDQIELLCRAIASLELDQEATMEFPVCCQGQESKLEVHLFLDDTDSPDLYFWAVPGLISHIEAEHSSFFEKDEDA